MDPKALAERHAHKVAEAAAAVAEEQQAKTAQTAARSEAADAIRSKLENVVLPFLDETKKAFPKNQFQYQMHNDLGTGRLLGVSFRINGHPEVEIRERAGRVAVAKLGIPRGRRPGPKQPVFFYRTDAGPFIGTAEDLTREKIGKLIEMVIDNA